jgi:E3 ubiquitin-protein ligase synoviolin
MANLLTFVDLLKLLAYLAFFTILTVFYGIPIYIIRDLYMTVRSFTKRISDYIKYQAATRDMNARYPDATAEDLASDGTCIVCREEMKPWAGIIQPGTPAPPNTTTNERQRPKKLPCGHILHFSCLQSWLERQQACPICRRSVFTAPPAPTGLGAEANGQPAAPGAPGANNANPANPNQHQARPHNRNEGRIFRFRLGPLRLQFGGGRVNAQQDRDQFVQDLFARLRDQRNANGINRPAQQFVATPDDPTGTAARIELASQAAALNAETVATHGANNESVDSVHPAVRSAVSHMQLDILEAQIRQEINSLTLANSRITGLRALLSELDRARALERIQIPGLQQIRGRAIGLPPLPGVPRFGVQQGVPNLNGIVVPPGWTLVPLNPVPVPTPTVAAAEASSASVASAAALTTAPGPYSVPAPTSQNTATPASSTSPSSTTTSSPSSAVNSPETHPLSDPVPATASSTAPLVPTPTWSFSGTPATATTSSSEDKSESVKEGKRPVSEPVGVPETVVEPPTPVRERECNEKGKGKQAFVEDAGGEDA